MTNTNVGSPIDWTTHTTQNEVITMIQSRIELELSFINDLYARHNNGDRHAKFLLTLYIREFELQELSLAHAKSVLYMMNNITVVE